MMVSIKVLSALIISSAVLAAPSPLGSRANDQCGPELYTLSDFSLVTSATAAYVNFNFESTFANGTGIIDAVINGVDCSAEGSSIPNNNECRTPDRKLLFDLRGPEDQAYYQITHTWTCNRYAHFLSKSCSWYRTCD
jgi:hypothetical protein